MRESEKAPQTLGGFRQVQGQTQCPTWWQRLQGGSQSLRTGGGPGFHRLREQVHDGHAVLLCETLRDERAVALLRRRKRGCGSTIPVNMRPRSSASPRSRFTWYASAPRRAGVSGLAKPRPDTGCFRLTLLLERLELGGPDVVGRAVSWVGRKSGSAAPRSPERPLAPKAQVARAFCLSVSNSVWLIAPLSRSCFAFSIWAAGLSCAATVRM
jgi:hypothetical protein